MVVMMLVRDNGGKLEVRMERRGEERDARA